MSSPTSLRHVDVAVIGAGQGGLSTAYHLRRFGFAPETGFVVLDADDAPGGAWQHRAGSLTMAKVHGIFRLPGTSFQPAEQDAERAVSEVVAAYFADYERRFALPVHRPVRVRSVSRDGEGLIVTTDDGDWSARAVVNATGTWSRPYWPSYPGAADFAGGQLHYADYRGPEAFAGRRVIVVGGGHSAMHVLSEIGDVAASTTWVTRRPPAFRDEEFTPEIGRNAVALVEERVRAGLPPQSVVSVTGLSYTTVVREALAKGALDRLPMFDRLTPGGAEWDDGRRVDADVVLWCTGFRPAIGHLAPLRLREHGGGIRLDGTRVVREPRLHLVGYGPSASTIGANRAGRDAARGIRDLLAGRECAAA
ncbi:MAG TPA: FAD-dependent oxidoreductase [Streptosporangiales bacterium]